MQGESVITVVFLKVFFQTVLDKAEKTNKARHYIGH